MAGRSVQFSSNGETSSGYLALPSQGSGPGVIVLQEWWGLVGHITDVADRFAGEGFVALAPDMYRGKKTTNPDEAGKLFMALSIAQVAKDLRGSIDYLLAVPECRGNQVGTVGFCMGGQLSLYAACANSKVGGCVVYYGIHPNVHPDILHLQAPVLGFFAERDASVPPQAVRKLEAELRAAGKRVEFHIYEDANHAFFNDTRPEVYHEASAKDSWNRMLKFFRDALQTPGLP
jgi:carboxymethylenebutenolidase